METGNKKTVVNSISSASSDFVDDSYDESLKALTYHLSIEIGTSSIGFAIFNLSEKKYVRWGKQTLEPSSIEAEPVVLESAIRKFPLLKEEYKSTSLACGGIDSILIPSAYYQKEKENDLLQYNFGSSSGIVMRDRLINFAAYHVYDLPEKWRKFIDTYWPNVKILHQSTVLIEQLVIYSKSVEETAVFADVQNNKVNVVIADNGKLLLSNSYECKAKEDVTYFVLSAFEQLEIRNYEIRLMLSGEVDQPLLDLLLKYVKIVETVENKSNLEYSKAFENPIYMGYTLFSQYLCA